MIDEGSQEPPKKKILALPHLGQIATYVLVSTVLTLVGWLLLLLPQFLEMKGWNRTEIGWAMGMYFLANLLFQIGSGHFSDQVGHMRLAIIGAIVSSASGSLYILSLSYSWFVLMARLAHGAGVAMITVGALMQLIKSFPTNQKGRLIGYFGLPGLIMLGAGPPLAEWLAAWGGFKAIFIAVQLLFLILLLMLVINFHPEQPPQAQRPPLIAAVRANLFGRGLWEVMLISLVFGFSFSCWNSFLAPLVAPLGAGLVSAFGIGYSVGAVATRLGLSQAVDSGHRRLYGVATLMAYGVSIALVPLAETPIQLGLLGLVCGAAHGLYYPSLSSIATDRFHPEYSGQALSLYISTTSLGLFIGGPCWGLLADLKGLEATFASAGLLLFVATLLFVVGEVKSRRLDQAACILSRQAAPSLTELSRDAKRMAD